MNKDDPFSKDRSSWTSHGLRNKGICKTKKQSTLIYVENDIFDSRDEQIIFLEKKGAEPIQ